MEEVDDFIPTLSQELFYDSEAPNQYFKGGVGAGKTRILCRKAIKIALQYPGIKILVTRTTGPALETTILEDFKRECPPDFLDIKKNKTKPMIERTFTNGSIIRFKAYEESDLDNLGSEFYGAIILEEAQQQTQKAWNRFTERLRQDKGIGIDDNGNEYETLIPKRFLIAIANPGGRNFLWRIFIRDNFDNPEYFSITSPTSENIKNLPPDYWTRLQKLPKHVFQRQVMGDDTPYEGLVFKDFSRELNGINVKGFVPPPHWPNYYGMDVGNRTPTTFNPVCVTEDGCFIVYREYRETYRTVKANAKAILTMMGSLVAKGAALMTMGVIDPQSNAHHTGQDLTLTVYQQFVQAGLTNLKPGSRDQNSRIAKLQQIIEVDEKLKNHPVTGEYREQGWPHLFFTMDCPETIQEFEEWEYGKTKSEDKDPDDKPEERNDHSIDAISYVIGEVYQFAPVNYISDEMWKNSQEYQWTKSKADYVKKASGFKDFYSRSPTNDGMH